MGKLTYKGAFTYRGKLTQRDALHVGANWQLKYLICGCFEKKLTQLRTNGTEEPLMSFSQTVLVLLL